MSLSADLLQHVADLTLELVPVSTNDVSMRRIVSALYYALFHRLNADAVALIAPNVTAETNHRIQRWFDHAEMKRVCGRFSKDRLDQPLLSLIGDKASLELQTVCRTFIDLQEARLGADYDLSYLLTRNKTLQFVLAGGDAILAWEKIKDTAEANIFVLSLLMFKNWEEKSR